MQIADNPVIVVLDTPGIMWRSRGSSLREHRAVLAGLSSVDAGTLPALTAAVMYTLAQPPNTAQLRCLIARGHPSSRAQARRQQRRHMVGLRDAAAAYKIARCILKALDDIAPLRHEEGTGCPSSRQMCSPVVKNGAAGRARHGRPQTAGAMLALLQASPDERDATRQATAGLGDQPSKISAHQSTDLAAMDKIEEVQTDAVSTTGAEDHAAAARQQRAPSHRSPATTWHWEPFDEQVWHACAEAALKHLLGSGKRGEVAEEQANAAMLRIVRLVSAGSLGRLLFEGGPPVAAENERKSLDGGATPREEVVRTAARRGSGGV